MWVLCGVVVVPARSAGYAAFITAGFALAPAAPARLSGLCHSPSPPRLRRLHTDPCGVHNTAPPPGQESSPLQQMRHGAHGGGHREEGGGRHARIRCLAGVSNPSRPGPPIEPGNPPLVLGNKRRCKLRTEAVQNEASEAVQIEEQAFVSDRVNQDPSDTHLPATAWPRQMRPSRASPLWSGSPDGS